MAVLGLAVAAWTGCPRRAAAWPQPGSDLPPDSGLISGTLDNGLRYAVLPHPEPRGRVSLRLAVRAGSLQERDDQRGLAHYLEHMAFRGTRHFSAGTLVSYFQRLGMDFGPDANAYTGFDRTVYQVELPDRTLEAIDEALQVLRDFADGMLLEEEEVEQERGVILSEKRARDSVGYRTALEEFAFLLPGTIVAERFPIGSAGVLRGVRATDLRAYYETWYRPDRMAVIVVGDCDPSGVPETIASRFGDFSTPPAAPEEIPIGRVDGRRLAARVHREPEATVLRVAVQAVQPYVPRPDTRAERIARMQRAVALQMLQRRLDTLAQAEESPFLRAYAGAYELFDIAALAAIEVHARPGRWDDALRQAVVELRRALDYGFRDEELEEARAIRIEALRQALREAPTRRARDLAEGLVAAFCRETVFTHPRDELALLQPALERMTVEDGRRAIQQAFPPEHRNIFVTGNIEPDNPEDALLAAYREAAALEIAPPPERETPAFAYEDFGTPGRIAEEEYIEDLDLYQGRFDNHARYNFKTTTFSAGEILLKVRISGGRLTEPSGRSGLGLLATEAFLRGGLGAHSHDELLRVFAGKTVAWHFEAAADAFVFSGRTTPEDLGWQLRWLTACLTDPGYRPEALRHARERLRERHTAAQHTARGVFRDRVSRFLAGGDPRFGLPPLEDLLALTLDEVRAWLEEPFARGYLEISLVGDIPERDEVRRLLAATVGALPERMMFPPDFTAERTLSPPEGGRREVFEFASRMPGGLAAVFWPAGDVWDIARTRRLNVLARVFSDRMRVHIRETQGDTYSPHASSDPSEVYIDYGWFFGIVDADPARAGDLALAITALAGELFGGGISDDEFERALRPTLTSLRDTVRNNRYWLNSVLASSQEYPQRLLWALDMREDYASITVADLEAYARDILDPEKSLQILVLPVAE